MSNEVRTLHELLGLDDRARAEASATILARSGKLVAARVVPGPLRHAAAESLIDASVAVLSSPLADIFGAAWTKARDIHRFTDRAKYPPGQTHEYNLGAHDIALKRNPEIELEIDGAPTGFELEFELKLALTLKSAVLRILDARIVGARIGDFQGSGSYSCGSVKLVERKTDDFRLPGDLSFAPGVAIPGA